MNEEEWNKYVQKVAKTVSHTKKPKEKGVRNAKRKN